MKSTSKKMKIIRWINFIGLNLCLLFMLPAFLVYKLNFKVDFFIAASNIAFLGFYLFIFIFFWVFLYFLQQEIRHCNNNKLNFLKHVFKNWIVLFGILPVCIYMLIKLNEF